MFQLPEAWVWDFWLVDDGEQYHLFFLNARVSCASQTFFRARSNSLSSGVSP